MRKRSIVILALVLVFAFMVTACAVRRPMQTPVQPRQDTTGLYNNNRGTGSGTGTATGTGTTTGTGTRMGAGNRTGTGTNTYTGIGPSSNNPYDLGYGGYGAAGTGRNYGGTGAAGNYGGAGATGGSIDMSGTGATGLGDPTYYGGYGGYGGYNNGMYGGYGNDYRNVGGSNNSANFGGNNLGNNISSNYGGNNTGSTTQADRIARSLEQMIGVDNATVVVNGTTAYVGIDTDGDLTGRNIAYGNATDLAAVKRACADRVRSSNPNIQTVYVSTDANFFDRLRRVGDGVRGGNPISGFRNELTELVRRVTPEKQ